MNSKVYADPNSSKGFAEYDDAQAEEQNQKMIEEQNKQVQATAGKSTNNYLENLKVEGYELTPKFDKQTVEYTLNANLKSKEINVIATPSDANAKVKGAGRITIQEGTSDLRIDVTAASGTVRTYIIHLKGQIDSSEQQSQEQTEPQEEIESVEEKTNTIQGEENKNEDNTESSTSIGTGWIIGIIALVIIFVIIVAIAITKKKKSKH